MQKQLHSSAINEL